MDFSGKLRKEPAEAWLDGKDASRRVVRDVSPIHWIDSRDRMAGRDWVDHQGYKNGQEITIGGTIVTDVDDVECIVV